MKLDPSKLYMMPFIMGPQYDKDPLPGLLYPQVENVVFQFQTEKEAAGRLVPDCYEVDPKPVVTVVFGYFKGLEFLAGGGYNIATVQISAKFNGNKDKVDGDYVAIMFEDNTMPILGGREYLGVPKLYADIPPKRLMPDGSFRCEASLWGHLLFGMDIPRLKKQNAVVKAVASKRINSRPWLGYKYFPALDGPPDADYPTITRNDVTVDDLWMGKQASIFFGTARESDVSHVANVIDAIKSLPVVKVEQVLRFTGSAVLRFDQSRRLR